MWSYSILVYLQQSCLLGDRRCCRPANAGQQLLGSVALGVQPKRKFGSTKRILSTGRERNALPFLLVFIKNYDYAKDSPIAKKEQQ
jgi:hypothetical protein